jgi:Gas vesicle protein G
LRLRVGFLSGLVTLPLAPVRGAAWVAEQVADEADRQLYDEEQIRREMMQLELDHDDGKIGEEERADMEDALLDRLAIAREREREERLLADEQGEIPDEEEGW